MGTTQTFSKSLNAKFPRETGKSHKLDNSRTGLTYFYLFLVRVHCSYKFSHIQLTKYALANSIKTVRASLSTDRLGPDYSHVLTDAVDPHGRLRIDRVPVHDPVEVKGIQTC